MSENRSWDQWVREHGRPVRNGDVWVFRDGFQADSSGWVLMKPSNPRECRWRQRAYHQARLQMAEGDRPRLVQMIERLGGRNNYNDTSGGWLGCWGARNWALNWGDPPPATDREAIAYLDSVIEDSRRAIAEIDRDLNPAREPWRP